MLFSSRARTSSRALAVGVGLGLVAAPLALVTPAAHAADPVSVNILGINDFHGRIAANGQEAGAAVLAGAVDELRAAQPNTVFAAAGDLIGASTFDSFIQDDKPTIDALNEAGLEVSAVGNHEFDQGYDDLLERVMAPESESNPTGGAAWEYIGANIEPRDSAPADLPLLEPSWTKTFGTGESAVTVGFVGAVTEELPSLVSPAGIADITVTDIVEATNTEADRLVAEEGADLVVLLVHEGAPSAECATMTTDPTSAFGSIVTGVNANVDAIISGHTHLAYDCAFPVAEWATQDRLVKERPVVSAGQYGYNLNQLTFSVDPADGSVDGLATDIVPLTTCGTTCDSSRPTWTALFDADQPTAAIVSDAVAKANVLGAVEIGELGGPFLRARTNGRDAQGAPALVENRGGESTAGNLIAEIQRWATSTREAGGAQIAFMNPGGIRADLDPADTYPAALTYRQAATVQSFANTLVNMTMTGAQIKAVLEQQWQPDGSSRPFLRLGASEGFAYTYDPSAARGSRITAMTLDGDPIGATETFSVTANQFLAGGGDNFAAFKEATGRRDTGKVDLQAVVDYLEEYAATTPLPVDYSQRAVGVDFGDAAPASYAPGGTVSFDVSSWSMSNADDVKDEQLVVSLGGTRLGTAAVDSALPPLVEGGTPTVFDEVGTASVSVTLPSTVSAGTRTLVLTGAATGTRVEVPVRVVGPASDKLRPTIAVKAPERVKAGSTAKVRVVVTAGGEPVDGSVRLAYRGRTLVKKLDDGVLTIVLGPIRQPGLVVLKTTFLGNPEVQRATRTVVFRVVK